MFMPIILCAVYRGLPLIISLNLQVFQCNALQQIDIQQEENKEKQFGEQTSGTRDVTLYYILS
ncbi:hypothetical protein LguiA_005741 [Lonicera macranthoides]